MSLKWLWCLDIPLCLYILKSAIIAKEICTVHDSCTSTLSFHLNRGLIALWVLSNFHKGCICLGCIGCCCCCLCNGKKQPQNIDGSQQYIFLSSHYIITWLWLNPHSFHVGKLLSSQQKKGKTMKYLLKFIFESGAH